MSDMQVVRIRGSGSPPLVLERAPALRPEASELVVRVHASALNRADLMQMRGLYPAPPGAPPDIPGLEYAGEVLEVGAAVRRFKVGDRVMGLVGGGAFAEQVRVHEREALSVPGNLSFEEAAAIPEAFLTAFDALVVQAKLLPGESVLIHAVASGVGSAAAQLCRAMGARALGTVRSAGKLDRTRAWGLAATHVVTADAPGFSSWAKESTGGRGVDVVLDLVGGTYSQQTLESLAQRGRWMLVGLVAGREATVDLAMLLSRRVQLTGTVMRSRPLEEKLQLVQTAERSLVPLFQSGALTPVIEATCPMRDVNDAVQRMERNDTVGKLVLTWAS